MWEALLGMGTKLLGGMMGQNAQENANAANQALAQTQMAYQHEANTHGVRWKVADAVAAGLHPLAALGMSPASGVSASVGRQEPETGMAGALGDIGQDISRAMNATRTQNERVAAFNEQLRTLALNRGELQNQALELQIKRLEQQLNPPFPNNVWNIPSGGIPGMPGFTDKPGDRIPASPSEPHREGGAITDVGQSRTPTGWASVPGKDIKERIEDVLPYEWSHFVRNNLYNSLGFGTPPRDIPLKEGHYWNWNTFKQEWQQRSNKYHPHPWHVRYR